MSAHSQHSQSYKNTKIMISCTSPKKAVIVYLGTESWEGGNKQRKLIKSMAEGVGYSINFLAVHDGKSFAKH